MSTVNPLRVNLLATGQGTGIEEEVGRVGKVKSDFSDNHHAS
jgi:hypothetical protein